MNTKIEISDTEYAQLLEQRENKRIQMNIVKNNIEAKVAPRTRALTICINCAEPKDVGLVVCQSCAGELSKYDDDLALDLKWFIEEIEEGDLGRLTMMQEAIAHRGEWLRAKLEEVK